jgi:hypothetical protein
LASIGVSATADTASIKKNAPKQAVAAKDKSQLSKFKKRK